MLYDERLRIDDLQATGLLDTPSEARFDVITTMACEVLEVPIALVSLVDVNRQWFKSCVGLEVTETGRDVSFCAHAIESSGIMVIPDATKDPRFQDNALVTGEPFIRFYAGRPIRGPGGTRIGTLCIIDTKPREVGETELAQLEVLGKLAEYEVRAGIPTDRFLFRDEAFLHQLIDTLPQEIALLDSHGTIIAVNASWLDFGQKNGGGSMLGQNYLASAPEDGSMKMLAKVVSGEADDLDLEYPCHAPNEKRWFRMQARRLSEQGITMVTHENITASKLQAAADRAVQEAVSRKDNALQQGAFKTRVMHTVAHEFNTPLTSMRIDMQLLERANGPSRHISQLKKGHRRLAGLVDEMVAMIELEHHEPFHPQTMTGDEMSSLFQKVATNLRLDHPVSVDLQADSTCELDPKWAKRLVEHLLTNAARFSEPHQTIHVAIQNQDGLFVQVTDEGAGLEPEMMDSIFLDFETRPAGQAGPGLGLYVCKRIAEGAGGSIGALSPGPGQGSTFWFRIPSSSTDPTSGAK